MRKAITGLFYVVLSALGGAMWVYSSYDDSPGGVLLGVVMIVLALVFSYRNANS